jgi:hypothetical protein
MIATTEIARPTSPICKIQLSMLIIGCAWLVIMRMRARRALLGCERATLMLLQR